MKTRDCRSQTLNPKLITGAQEADEVLPDCHQRVLAHRRKIRVLDAPPPAEADGDLQTSLCGGPRFEEGYEPTSEFGLGPELCDGLESYKD
jgi:hypothetical protein